MASMEPRFLMYRVNQMDDEQREYMFREGFICGIIYAIDEIKHEIDLDHDSDITLENIMLKLSNELIREKYESSAGFQSM